MADNSVVLKVVVLGDGRVGKTSILFRYFKNSFNESEKSTENPNCYTKIVNYKGTQVKITFWDTAGQEKFHAITTIYYQGAVGALLVYDVTKPETFDRVEEWANTLREMNRPDIPIIIAGNKIDNNSSEDLENISKVKPKAEEFAVRNKCLGYFTSAKTGFNVKEAIEKLFELVLEKEKPDIKKKDKGTKKLIVQENNSQTQKKGCCN